MQPDVKALSGEHWRPTDGDVARLGLEFLGLELSPALARTYRERFPDDPFLGFAIKVVAERLRGLPLAPRG